MQLYIRDAHNNAQGPYSEEQIRNALANGTIRQDTQVCLAGGSLWRPVGSLFKGGRNTATLNEDSLKDKKEELAFGWLGFFSIPVSMCLFFFFFRPLFFMREGEPRALGVLLGVLFGNLLFFGVIALLGYLIRLSALAYLKTNAIEVSERQLPEIYLIAKSFADKLGKPLPTIYVLQRSIWNAFATKLAGKRLVVLCSGAVDSLLEKGPVSQLAFLVGHELGLESGQRLPGYVSQLAFLVGHELGHHYAGHLDFWKRVTVRLGSWFIWVYFWHSRRSELTADRYGLACAGNLEESLRTVCNMTVGAQLASEVNIDEAVEQWNKYSGEFFVKYRAIYSTHPHLLNRLVELKSAARELGIQ
jgi:Zn-dependent protease with chaperone function